MNEVLMRDDHFMHGPLEDFPGLLKQAGRKIADINLPASCHIVMLERYGHIIVPVLETELRASDEVAIIGEPIDLKNLREGSLELMDETEDTIDDEE